VRFAVLYDDGARGNDATISDGNTRENNYARAKPATVANANGLSDNALSTSPPGADAMRCRTKHAPETDGAMVPYFDPLDVIKNAIAINECTFAHGDFMVLFGMLAAFSCWPRSRSVRRFARAGRGTVR
jgi:hypothetical protein